MPLLMTDRIAFCVLKNTKLGFFSAFSGHTDVSYMLRLSAVVLLAWYATA